MTEKLNYFTAIKFLWKYVRKHISHFIRFYIGWFCDLLLSIAMPIMFGIMINEIIYEQDVDTFLKISLVVVIMSLFSCVLYFFIYAQHHYLMSMYTFDIKRDLFRSLQNCKAEFLTNSSTGDIIATLQWYTNECMHFVIRNIIHFVNGIIEILLLSAYLFIIDWRIGLFALVAAPLSVFITTKFSKKIRTYGDNQRECYGGYISWVFEVLQGIRDIRMLGAEKKTNSIFETKHKELFAINVKSGISSLTANNVISLVGLLVQLSIFTFAGFLAKGGNITVGGITVVVAFYSSLIARIKLTSQSFLDSQQRVSYIQRIYDYINSPSEEGIDNKKELKIINGEICFNNVNFAYKNGNPVLQNFSLKIPSGGKFALVGKSGCGKSTLAYMLIGFYAPQCGDIIIDGQNLKDCSSKSIRKNIGLIAQDVLVFEGTIRSNIMLGNSSATKDDIISACEKAGIWDFIKTLPQGLETAIGNNGIGLSGGQKQRIAIARIYLKNPKIIIFDEATSSLDNETEREIHDAWRSVLENRTSIVIAHRQSSVMLCSSCAMIEDGAVCEIGMPMEMAKSSEKFKTLFAIKEREV